MCLKKVSAESQNELSAIDTEHIRNFGFLANLKLFQDETVDRNELQNKILISNNNNNVLSTNSHGLSTITPELNTQGTPLSSTGKLTVQHVTVPTSIRQNDAEKEKPGTIQIIKEIPVPVEKPIFIKVLEPVPEPYPVIVRQPVEVKVPVPVYIKVPETTSLSANGIPLPRTISNQPTYRSETLPGAIPLIPPPLNQAMQSSDGSRGLIYSYVSSKNGGTYGSHNKFQTAYYQKTW